MSCWLAGEGALADLGVAAATVIPVVAATATAARSRAGGLHHRTGPISAGTAGSRACAAGAGLGSAGAARGPVTRFPFLPGWNPLGYARVEVQAIQRLFAAGARVLAEEAATGTAVAQGLPGATHLHLACHGAFDLGEPLIGAAPWPAETGSRCVLCWTGTWTFPASGSRCSRLPDRDH